MEIISHRGNLDGPDPSRENTIEAITGAMALGYSVEFDVRMLDGYFYFGHDKPQMPIDLAALSELNQVYDGILYAHCKTVGSLQKFSSCPDLHYEISRCSIIPFFHDIDECVLLINGQVWIHPRVQLTADIMLERTIYVSPGMIEPGNLNGLIDGICTDYPNSIKKALE